MKTNIVPSKKVALLFGAFCAVMLAFAQNASAIPKPIPPNIALTFNDSHVVGTVTPVTPASPEARADYINFMIALAPGGAGVLDGNTITRSTNLFGSLPTADATGALTGSSTTINLGAGGFTYLFAKYDGQNDISFVWNVAGLTGNVTIPQDGPLGHGLSGWVLFGGGGNGVPDGGATVMLLGASLGALGMLRRYLKS
jgi:VPDSG-CTERM motif